jgi:signal transduction histidine kinase
MTLRLRLTVLSTGLFVAAGAALLTVTYLLVARTLPATTSPGVKDLKAQNQLCQHAIKFGPQNLAYKCKLAYHAGIRLGATINHRQTLHDLLVYSIIGLIVTAVLVAWIAWIFAGRALRPVQNITATARSLSAQRLDQRLRVTGPNDELKELADTFDDMLERLTVAFSAQERFVANAAHELRTPLTIMRTEIDVTFGRATHVAAHDQARAIGVVQSAIARSERLVDALLTLAHSDIGLTTTENVDVAELVRACVDQRRDFAAERELAVSIDATSVNATGDRLLLEQLVGNLIDNAVRHNIPNGWIQVQVRRRDDQHAVIQVTNSTAAIADGEIESIFEPFRRLSRNSSGPETGNGLGLSIVRSVATAHHGAVRASSDPTTEFTIEVTLPAGGDKAIAELAPASSTTTSANAD